MADRPRLILGQTTTGSAVALKVTASGILSIYPKYEYLIEMAMGNIPQHTLITLAAENELVGIVAETIWPVGGRYPWLASGSILTVVSSSANDTISGSGIRTVQINGLDDSYTAISENVELNGTTPVTTSATFYRVNEMVALTAGSSLNASANIDVKVGSGILARIEPSHNISRQSIFSVPANTTLILTDFNVSTGFGDEGTGTIYATEESNGITFEVSSFYFYQNSIVIPSIIKFNEKRDIEIVARNTAGAGTIRVQLFVNFILRDN